MVEGSLHPKVNVFYCASFILGHGLWSLFKAIYTEEYQTIIATTLHSPRELGRYLYRSLVVCMVATLRLYASIDVVFGWLLWPLPHSDSWQVLQEPPELYPAKVYILWSIPLGDNHLYHPFVGLGLGS